LYFMQFDQSEKFFTDGRQVNLRIPSSNLNILWNILETSDGQIKSKRYTVQWCQTKAWHMVAGNVEFLFAFRNERSLKRIEIKTWNNHGEENAWYLST